MKEIMIDCWGRNFKKIIVKRNERNCNWLMRKKFYENKCKEEWKRLWLTVKEEILRK